MVPYANAGGNSGIAAYGIAPDSITVQFKDGHIYRYDYGSAGAGNIERMKMLAYQGSGLHSFINLNVKYQYAQRLR